MFRILPLLPGDEGLIPVNQVGLFGLLDEPGPELGVGDGDQLHGPFPDVLAVEVGDPVFGDHVMDVAPDQGDPGPLPQEGDDAGDLSLLGRGLDGEDGLAARGHDGARA